MNQIKFSKCSYCKLPAADKAILKYATVIKLEEQTHAFLDYDTTYIEFGEVINCILSDFIKTGQYSELDFQSRLDILDRLASFNEFIDYCVKEEKGVDFSY